MSKPSPKKKASRPAAGAKVLGVVWWVFVVSIAGIAGVVGNMLTRSSLLRTIINPFNYLNVDPKKTFNDYDGLVLMILGTDEDRKMIGWAVDEHGHQHAVTKVTRHDARADMILVAKLDFDKKTITGLSIPRDTGIRIPELDPRILKINGYYSVAPHGQGSEYMKKAVEKLLPGLHIDRTLTLNYDAFQELVDTVGGVPVVVPKGINGKGLQYDDNAGDLHIHLAPGPQTLDGKAAMGYVRFRHDTESDYGRQQRQKEFLTSFKSQVIRHLFKLPEIAEESKAVVGNALSDQEIFALVSFSRSVPPKNIKLGMLPTVEGRTRGGALRVVQSKRDEAMREYGLLPSDDASPAPETKR